ncbi:MAG TPA: hypothetical protein VF069_08205 [Streptosporangiaceae bacterium]
MWIGALLSSTAATFGRLLIVGILPNSILVAYVWLLLTVHAFTNRGKPLTFYDLVPDNFKSDAGGLILGALLVLVLTMMVQPFQIRLVRLLEGYWQANRIGVVPHRVASAFHERRRERLLDKTGSAEDPLSDTTLCEMHAREQCREQRQARRRSAAADRAVSKLRLYPPPGEDVLPTMLGNALRRNESIAGERYGLKTIHTWPRLYPYLSDNLAKEYRAQIDSIDASTNLALVFTLMSGVGVVAFANDQWLLIVPALLLLLAVGAYRAAIAAVSGHGVALAAAYDLHRFDMLRALHLELPSTPELEAVRNQKLSDFFYDTDEEVNPGSAEDLLEGFTYVHDFEE